MMKRGKACLHSVHRSPLPPCARPLNATPAAQPEPLHHLVWLSAVSLHLTCLQCRLSLPLTPGVAVAFDNLRSVSDGQ